ncbi:FtsX-like permease family protein [Microbacterium sp. X-17]|uniref:ABC transporter permease n=1 Tax=Microbacterium sp. X-17 TaxID=3144404 RepID=UPI0031F5900E
MSTVAEARMPRRRGSLGWLRDRGMGASILVAAVSSAFGAILLSAVGYISALLRADPLIGDSHTLALVLSVLAVLFVGVAVYVGAIVTANTFATVVAGRTRQIALLRLIGASARSQRAEVTRQGLVVGCFGAAAGLVFGILVAFASIPIVEASFTVAHVSYGVLQPVLLVPAVVVALTTWAAAGIGSRRVLTVTPLQALGGSTEAAHAALAHRGGRNRVAVALILAGAVLLGGGVLLGLLTPLGIGVAFFGGVLSFTGLSLGATVVMPPVLRLVGRCFGRSAVARLAAENAMRYPERSSRMAIGVVMGVTLVTMFAVAIASVRTVLTAAAGGQLPPEIGTVLDTFTTIMSSLVGVSAVIAAIGLVNLLTLGVVQRRRELGLLRALGLSKGQVRRVVLLEAAHITIASVVVGLLLGVLYGWVAAQSLLGSVRPTVGGAASAPELVAPGIPWIPLAVVVAGAVVLTLIASATPTRLATRVPPVAALAE